MKRPPPSNRRQYRRLDSVFPVQFRIASLDGKEYVTDWIQGFTHNVSKGGLRLDVNNFELKHIQLLKSGAASIFVQIQIPLSRPAVNAQADVAWISDSPDGENRCCIGLSFREISTVGQRRIMRVVMAKVVFVPAIMTLVFLLGLGFAVNGYISIQLVRGNKALVQQLIKILQESIVAKQKIDQISTEKEDLQLKIGALQVRIQTIEEEKAKFAKDAEVDQIKSASSLKELNRTIEQLTQEKAALQEQLIGLQHKENAVTEELLQIDQKRAVLEKANFDAMYRWLVARQNSRTGLVTDHAQDQPPQRPAYVYDQALAALAYVNFRDFERARAVLDFFSRKARRSDGFFFSAYSVQDTSPAEPAPSSGPTIWAGIAALQYTRASADQRYLSFAEDIASAVMEAQRKAADGAIPSGPGSASYSVRHNLDGYAFFDMLYGLTRKEPYRQAQDAIRAWLRGHMTEDAYAWSVVALGPATVEEIGLNPDQILESAEARFGVQAQVTRHDGQSISVKGFDFRSPGATARDKAVAAEPTAQMVSAYKIMADYYRLKDMSNKARSYAEKADASLQQLCTMIVSRISSSGQSEGYLPQTSAELGGTGAGGMTPQAPVAGSISATASTLFAFYNYNPLQFAE